MKRLIQHSAETEESTELNLDENIIREIADYVVASVTSKVTLDKDDYDPTFNWEFSGRMSLDELKRTFPELNELATEDHEQELEAELDNNEGADKVFEEFVKEQVEDEASSEGMDTTVSITSTTVTFKNNELELASHGDGEYTKDNNY